MELLEQHFDTAFSAANGIQKLRELILTLAMQGKLVPQHRSDAPTSQLLKEIEAEKKRLAKEGKIKAPKPLPEITSSDAPYALPQGWQWVRLGSVGNIFNGNSINASEKEAKYAGAKGLPYIATKDVGYGFDPLDYENGICIPVGEDKFRLAHEGAVLICAEGGSAGKKCGLTDRDICFGNKLFANELYGQIPSRFILYTYLSPVFRASFAAAMSGIIGGVSIAKFVEIPIPLPPLDEQHRIVAKIDQLMARCDALEKLRKARDEKRLVVHAAARSQLLGIPGNGSADQAWGFITQHFGELYAVRENIAELRKAILQLAVMGKLVPQDFNDPPASQLLKNIEAEKKWLVNDGAIRGTRGRGDVKELTPDEMPNPLPKGWQWVRLSSVFVTSSGNTFDATLEKETGAFAYVKVGDMNLPGNELFITTSSRFIDPDKKMSRALIPTGSIIFPKRGGAIATNKKRIVCNPIFVDLNTMAITPIQGVVIDYAYLWLLTIDLATLNTGTSVPQINHQDIDPLPFPLPPQPEQHRIVAKVDQLMGLCDTLEERITAATRVQTELLNAVMAQV